MGAKNEGQNRTFYKLQVEKETNVPTFTKQKKDSNGTWVVDQQFNTITGFLKKVELSNYVYEGDTIDKIKFIFDDDEDATASFQVETNINYLSRGILNSLLGADSIGHVMIRVYTTKGKDNNSSKVFPQAYVEINHQKANWKYEPQELPKAKEVKVGGKTMKDTTELDEFFKLLIPEINSKIVNEIEVESEMKSNHVPPVNYSSGREQVEGTHDDFPKDDLPFKSNMFRRTPTMIRRLKY